MTREDERVLSVNSNHPLTATNGGASLGISRYELPCWGVSKSASPNTKYQEPMNSSKEPDSQFLLVLLVTNSSVVQRHAHGPSVMSVVLPDDALAVQLP